MPDLESTDVALLVVAVLLAMVTKTAVHLPWIGAVALTLIGLTDYLKLFLGCVIAFHGIEIGRKVPDFLRKASERQKEAAEVRKMRWQSKKEEIERKKRLAEHAREMKELAKRNDENPPKLPGPFDAATKEYLKTLEQIEPLPIPEKEKDKARETAHRLYAKKIEKLLG
jgi:chorismate mutase